MSNTAARVRLLAVAALAAAAGSCSDVRLQPVYALAVVSQAGDSLSFSGNEAFWYTGSTYPSPDFSVSIGPTEHGSMWPLLKATAYSGPGTDLPFPNGRTFHVDTLPPDLFRVQYQGAIADSGYVAFQAVPGGFVLGDVSLWFGLPAPLGRVHVSGRFVACESHLLQPLAACIR
jgi:hypothetical protein